MYHGHSGTAAPEVSPPSRRMGWLWHNATFWHSWWWDLAKPGSDQGRVRLPPELMLHLPLQIPGGNFPEGRQHGSGHRLQHPPAVPDCHPPRVSCHLREAQPGQDCGVRHSDRENQPQKQLVGRGRGWAGPRRVAAGGQGAQGRWVLAVLFRQLHTPCSVSRRASAPSSRPRTENSKAPGLQHQTSCQS